MSAPAELLAWDTQFFGFRVARVAGETLDAAAAEQVDAWSRAQAVRCLYFLARPDDPDTLRAAEDRGFRLVDVRLTFGLPLGGQAWTPAPAAVVRPAEPADAPALDEMARAGFTDTRFFFDAGFPRERAEALYALWLAGDLQAAAQDPAQAAVWVAGGEPGRPAGFLTARLKEGRGQIGLVGVGVAARGRGLGQALVRTALAWCAARGAAEVRVVTQGRNLGAQRLYQRCGLISQALQLWYHKWYSPVEDVHA